MRHRSRLIPLLAALAALVAIALPAHAAGPAGPVGHWEGAVQLPGSALEVQVDLCQDDAGVWSGAIDIPAQAARQLPLTAFAVDGDKVRFAIRDVPGDPTFDGALGGDGNEISGSFTQGAFASTFKLTRAAAGADAVAQALAGFADQVQGVLDTLHVASAGVAIVRNDEVVFAEGFGQRDREAGLPATADTLYAIGSSTKAFTTLLLGTFVDAGALDWDAPVLRYLPEFRLEETERTEEISVRDLVTHRSGLPRHDLVWYRAHLDRREIVRRLRFLDASYPLRTHWQYQNGMFVTAGVVAEKLGGASWEELVRARILDPLGMKRTNFSVVDSQHDADFAQPYEWSKDRFDRVPFQEIPGAGPAGSINSSAREMAEWLRLQLGGGAHGATRVVRASTLAEMQRIQMPMEDPAFDPEFLNRGYGMGWFVEVYRGHKRVQHGGNIDGFSAQVALLPDDQVGVVVLTNGNGSAAPEVIARIAADRLLGLEPIDWLTRVKARVDAAESAISKAGDLAATYDRKTGTHPAHPLAEYAGDYGHPAYGVVHVESAGRQALAATFHGIPIALEHWHYETFRATTDDKTLSDLKLYFLFRTNTKGDVDALSVALEPAVASIVFDKLPPARLSDPAFLATLEGGYELAAQPGFVIRVSLAGDELVAKAPGQPNFPLIPYAGTEFKLGNLSGYSVRFLLDAAGRVEKMLLLQPDGVYEATPKKE